MNRWHLSLLALLAITAAVYGFGLWDAGFVWDDVPLIVMNDSLGRLDGVPALFGADLWAESGAGNVQSGYYRPLVLMSFSVDRALFGLEPLGYHLHSLAWHLVVVASLYWLLKDLLGEGRALAGAAVCALHPVQSECVAWISARNDLMAAAFALLSLAVLQSRGRSVVGWWLGALLACAAVLSKESAFLLPILVWVLNLGRSEADRAPGAMVAVCMGIGAALLMRVGAGVGAAALPPVEGWVLVGRHADEWLGAMFGSLAWPSPVSSAHDLHWTDLVPRIQVYIGWVFIVGLVVASALQARRPRRLALGGLAWAAAGLLLVVVPMADKGGFGARFWYMPMLGMAVAIASLVPRRFAVGAVLGIVVPSVVILHVRLPDWRSDSQMWAASARDVPSPINHVGLAHAMAMTGRQTRAHVGFVGALSTDRLALDACSRVVGTALKMGRAQHAVRMGKWALARGCKPSLTLVSSLSVAEVLVGRWEDAEQTLGLLPKPHDRQARVVAAAIAQNAGDSEAYDEAVQGDVKVAAGAAQLVGQAAKAGLTE